MFKRKLSYVQWMALFILTIGCTVQRVNWSNVKGEMDHENQISSSSMNKEKHKEQSNHIFGHILNQADVLWVILQVINDSYTCLFYKFIKP